MDCQVGDVHSRFGEAGRSPRVYQSKLLTSAFQPDLLGLSCRGRRRVGAHRIRRFIQSTNDNTNDPMRQESHDHTSISTRQETKRQNDPQTKTTNGSRIQAAPASLRFPLFAFSAAQRSVSEDAKLSTYEDGPKISRNRRNPSCACPCLRAPLALPLRTLRTYRLPVASSLRCALLCVGGHLTLSKFLKSLTGYCGLDELMIMSILDLPAGIDVQDSSLY